MRAALHADSIADFSPLYKGIRKAQQSSSAKKKSSAARHGMRQFEARFVSKARGRTFRRRSRRNPAGHSPRSVPAVPEPCARGAYTLKSLLSEAAKGIQPHSVNCFFIPAVPAAGALQTETAAENPRLPRKKPPTKMAVSLLAPPSIRPAGIQKSLPPQWNP